MGNNISWPEALAKNFQLASKDFSDPYFGTISIYQKKTDPTLQVFCTLSIYQWINSKKMQGYRRSTKFKHPNLLCLLHLQEEPSKGCSGSNGLITLHMEYPGTTTLASIIQAKTNFWKEPQIWEIINQIVDAGVELQKNNLYHGDIRPETIFITENSVKIVVNFMQIIYLNKRNIPPCQEQKPVIKTLSLEYFLIFHHSKWNLTKVKNFNPKRILLNQMSIVLE